ncbi:divergent PAP2 family protein [Patescibacteria group bacterium]|nr:divergent PAP2 family protein [Patescibacteria group bacterium]MBU1124270.1 divergent PAP2 family protein [Patescibacteria group bacterium]MBU1910949.1 divergent PAP2 family protein [Patescibacteria group bacterium]
MQYLQQLLSTYPFLIPLVVLLLSELVKVINRIREGSGERLFFRQGGMPSSHSAFVMSLLIVVGRKMGIESIEFAIALCFAGIVWYDAIAVRGTVSKHAKALNVMQEIHQFSEEVGHTVLEVIAGIAFGAFVTGIGILLS